MNQNIVYVPNNKLLATNTFQNCKYLKVYKKHVLNFFHDNNVCVYISKYNGIDTINKLYLRMDLVNNFNIAEHEIFIVVKLKESPFYEKEIELFRLSYFFLRNFHFHENKKNNNRYASNKYLRIPLELFIGEIYLFPDEVDKLIISIEYKKNRVEQDNLNNVYINQNSFIEDILTYSDCIVEGTLYTDEKKKNMRLENFCGQQIQYMYIYNIYKTSFSLPLHFDGICKGLFICMDNFDDINNIELHINNQVHIEYDKELITLLCKKISNYMFYIPFDSNYEFDCPNTNSYDCNILFNNENKCKLIIESDTVVSEIYIYAMILKNYTYKNNKLCNIPQFDVYKYYNYFVEKGIFLGNKLLSHDKLMCVISHEEIKYGSYYAECKRCKNAVINNVLNQYIQINNDRRCPMCRVDWDNENESNDEIYYFCNKENDFTDLFFPQSISYLEEINL